MVEELQVSPEFIEENRQLCQSMPKSRKNGPRTKQEKTKRRDEVYRLHFEYGYSARKISELMNVNRNTINGDVSFWYSRIGNKTNYFDPIDVISTNVERLDLQRTRLREQLDKTESFSERIALERLIYDIDCKILYTFHRMTESSKRLLDLSTERLNHAMKKEGNDDRYLTFSDRLCVSRDTRDKIEKIIKEDHKKIWSRTN